MVSVRLPSGGSSFDFDFRNLLLRLDILNTPLLWRPILSVRVAAALRQSWLVCPVYDAIHFRARDEEEWSVTSHRNIS